MALDDYVSQTPKVVPDLIARARAGDRDAVLRLLDLFSVAAKNNDPVLPELMSWLADAFEKVTGADDSEKAKAMLNAFNLQNPRHRPAKKETERRNCDIAFMVQIKHAQGIKGDAAVVEVADLFNLSFDSILKIYKKNKNPMDEHLAGLLADFCKNVID